MRYFSTMQFNSQPHLWKGTDKKGQKPLDDFFETCLFYNWHQAKLERIHCYVHFIYGIRINLCDYKRAQAYHLQPGWCHCYGQELSSLNHPLRIAYPPDLYMNTPFQRETFFETMLLLYCCIHTMRTRTKFVCYPLKSRCHMFVLMFFYTIIQTTVKNLTCFVLKNMSIEQSAILAMFKVKVAIIGSR